MFICWTMYILFLLHVLNSKPYQTDRSGCSTSHCSDQLLKGCERYAWNKTSYPNFLGQNFDEAKSIGLSMLQGAEAIGCSDVYIFLICSTYSPPCISGTNSVVPPCRYLCEHALQDCRTRFLEYDLHWPSNALRCEQLPDIDDSDDPCMDVDRGNFILPDSLNNSCPQYHKKPDPDYYEYDYNYYDNETYDANYDPREYEDNYFVGVEISTTVSVPDVVSSVFSLQPSMGTTFASDVFFSSTTSLASVSNVATTDPSVLPTLVLLQPSVTSYSASESYLPILPPTSLSTPVLDSRSVESTSIVEESSDATPIVTASISPTVPTVSTSTATESTFEGFGSGESFDEDLYFDSETFYEGSGDVLPAFTETPSEITDFGTDDPEIELKFEFAPPQTPAWMYPSTESSNSVRQLNRGLSLKGIRFLGNLITSRAKNVNGNMLLKCSMNNFQI